MAMKNLAFDLLPEDVAQRVFDLGYDIVGEDGTDYVYLSARNWVEDLGPFDNATEAAEMLFQSKGEE